MLHSDYLSSYKTRPEVCHALRARFGKQDVLKTGSQKQAKAVKMDSSAKKIWESLSDGELLDMVRHTIYLQSNDKRNKKPYTSSPLIHIIFAL